MLCSSSSVCAISAQSSPKSSSRRSSKDTLVRAFRRWRLKIPPLLLNLIIAPLLQFLKASWRIAEKMIQKSSQPRSQGLSSSHKREWSKKDPGLGWSRVLLTKLSSCEGFQFCRKLSPLAFVTSKTRLEQSPCFLRVFIVRFHVAATGMLI